MDESGISDLVESMEVDTKSLKEEIYRISWAMRGGVSSKDLFYLYSKEDRDILNKIVKDNIELSNKAGVPII